MGERYELVYLDALEQSKKRLSKEDQLTFRQDCLRLLTELRHPSPYFDEVKVRFCLDRQDYPGLKVLNMAFEDAQIPYRIRAKQPGKTLQCGSWETYWLIEKSNAANHNH